MQNKSNEISGNLQSVNMGGGYTVYSCDVIEQEEDCGLVRGHGLQVKNSNGQVVYEDLRAFLPLNDKMNLVRLADKMWVIVYLNQSKKRVILKKANLRYGKFCFCFDADGKMHPNQVSPHYQKNIEA